MTLNEIENLWDIDSEIDSNNLDTESLSIPKLYNKYMKIQNKVSYEISVIESAINKLTVEKIKYYKGWCDQPYNKKITIASDLKSFIEGDSDMVLLKMKQSNAELRFKTLDRILKQVEIRGHHVKTALDYRKFIEGAH